MLWSKEQNTCSKLPHPTLYSRIHELKLPHWQFGHYLMMKIHKLLHDCGHSSYASDTREDAQAHGHPRECHYSVLMYQNYVRLLLPSVIQSVVTIHRSHQLIVTVAITCSIWQELELHGRIRDWVCSMQSVCVCLQTALLTLSTVHFYSSHGTWNSADLACLVFKCNCFDPIPLWNSLKIRSKSSS